MDDVQRAPYETVSNRRVFLLLDDEPINLFSIEEAEPEVSKDSLTTKLEDHE